MGFLKRDKEIKSDLHYKVSTIDGSTFDYQRNKRSKKKNKKEINLSPGDWVTVSNFKNLKFEEKKFKNWLYIFYIKNISLLLLIFQIILLVSYAVSYAFAIYTLSTKSSVLFGALSIFNGIVLFAPIVVLTVKAAATFTRTITNGGPNRSLHNKFSKFESITIRDSKKGKRTIFLDSEGNFSDDKGGEYFYGDAEKFNSNVYKFNLLIINKNDTPLHKVEYYTIQIDFEQLEGIQITKSKKLESYRVTLNEYKIKKTKKDSESK